MKDGRGRGQRGMVAKAPPKCQYYGNVRDLGDGAASHFFLCQEMVPVDGSRQWTVATLCAPPGHELMPSYLRTCCTRLRLWVVSVKDGTHWLGKSSWPSLRAGSTSWQMPQEHRHHIPWCLGWNGGSAGKSPDDAIVLVVAAPYEYTSCSQPSYAGAVLLSRNKQQRAGLGD